MPFRVFVQNEAGSNRKNYHDEKTFEWRRVVPVSRRYPYPYGFVVETTGSDGWNVDCFVITSRPLRTGAVVKCEALGLMEQIEDGEVDHNVLARFEGEHAEVSGADEETLTEFVRHVFDHVPGKHIQVGRFLGRGAAEAHIEEHRDST